MGFHPVSYKKRTRGVKGTEYILVCPFCSGDLHWNATIQGGRCFRCDAKFNTLKMNFHFRGTTNTVVDNLIEKATRPERPPAIQKPVDYDYQKHWQARWHLEDYRRCSPKTLNEIGVWYEEETDSVCIPIQPVYAGGGNVEQPYMARHTDPDIKGWKAQPPGIEKERYWFAPGRVYDSKTIVLVEGIFDVLTPRLEDIAIATLGTKLSSTMQGWFWLHPDVTVVLWYDPDLGGDVARKTIAAQLYGVVKRLVVMPPELPEPGDLTPIEVMKEIHSALCEQS